MVLKHNVGRLDQVVRGGISVIAIYFGFVDPSHFGEPMVAIFVGIFGLMNLFSTLTGNCPVYQMAGISTCPAEDK